MLALCINKLIVLFYWQYVMPSITSHWYSHFGRAMQNSTLSIPEPDSLPGTSTTTCMPYTFVGDAAFPLKTYMLRPYPG